MFEHQKRVEIERRVLKAGDERAKAGLPPASIDSLRLIAADELEHELEARRQERIAQRPVASRQTAPRVALPVARTAKPLTRPQAAAKPPVPPYLTAERARVSAIIAEAPAGAEAERDEAIASGSSVETFRGILAGQAILTAMREGGEPMGHRVR